MQVTRPPRLKKGDKVGVFSPSSTVRSREEIVRKGGEELAKKLGIEIIYAPHTFGRHYYSSGTTEERLADFHELISDSSIKAIFFSIGGNTAIDMVSKIDYELVKKYPKIISGISDATTLLNPIYAKTGLITFLGLEFRDFGIQPMAYSLENMQRTWFEALSGEIKPNPDWRDFDNLPTSYTGWQTIRPGKVTGRIVGGNFNSTLQLLGTDYAPSVDGAIYVLETYKSFKKNIHRSLMHFRLKGHMDKIAGMIVGYCLGSDDPKAEGDERTMKDMLLEVTDGYNFPIMQIGEIGHNVENMMLPIGAMATMDAGSLQFSIDEPVVT